MDRLLSLRKEKELTQQEISKALGLPRSTYAHYEMGKRQPDYDTLTKIADFFDVTIDYILCRTDIPHPDRVLTRDEIATVLGEEAGAEMDKEEFEWLELYKSDIKGKLTADEMRDLVKFAIRLKDKDTADKEGFDIID